MSLAMSARRKATAWWRAMGTPKATRSSAYRAACSMAARARPTAAAATGGRVWSNAFMASIQPCPTWPTTFSSGTSTSSKVTPRVSEARWPMFHSLRPTETPFQARSTTNAVMPPRAFSAGSVTASTKYQSATPALVIHIFWPLSTQRSPLRSARVRSACTSDPAPGSVTQ